MSSINGIKNIQITAATRYPVVSAYEYEFLKGEDVVRQRMSNCSIYFILQRPVTYFENVTLENCQIHFDIVDGVHPPLRCEFDLVEAEIMEGDETIIVEIQYYKKTPDVKPPFNDVAAFKVLRKDGTFVLWETPQKFLYEVLINGLPANIAGNVEDFLDYHVHYIGKAFSQKIWKRLTGHDNFQKILTVEDTLGSKNSKVSVEIAILMLDIVGVDEINLIGTYDFAVPKGVSPIIHTLSTDADMDKFFEPATQLGAPELTSEIEALLVSLFKPEYNQILFDNYPNIDRGMRSIGYTYANLIIENLPIILKSKYHSQHTIFPNA